MIDHVDYLIAYIRQRARSFTENAKRRLNVSLQMQKKNTQCVSITNGLFACVGTLHFNAGSIDIECTAYNFFHDSLLSANPEMCCFP